MADLDDLLGGPSTAHKEIDDLLGDSPIQNNGAQGGTAGGGGGLAFDDDLFGTPLRTDQKIAFEDDDLLGDVGGAGGAATTQATPKRPSDGPKDNNYSPQPGVRKRAMGTINAAAVKDVPSSLAPYATTITSSDAVYFIRFVQVIENTMLNMNHASSAKSQGPTQRIRMVLRVTSGHLSLFCPSLFEGAKVAAGSGNLMPQAIREIPIEKVFGVVTQSVVVPKLFGAKETEFQILIQIREESDILIALSRDNANGAFAAPERDGDLLQALAAVSFAYGMTMPISSLHEGEMIEKMVNRHVGKRGDEKLRQRQSEQLAFRSELTAERNRLQQELDRMVLDIEKLKVSDIAKAADQIQVDISEHEKAINQFRRNTATLQGRRRQLDFELEAINRSIRTEADRRQGAAKDTMAAVQHEAFKRQVSEFEQMKSAHKRDMDKLSNLISFAERRVAAKKGKMLFNGVLDISDRLEVLEDEQKFLEDQLSHGREAHARQMAVLTTAKKQTLPEGKELLQSMIDELKLLQSIKESLDRDGDAKAKTRIKDYEIPVTISREKPKPLELPNVAVKQNTEAAGAPTTATSSQSVQQPAASAPPAAPKPTVNLDDDDDDDFPAPTQPVSAPAATTAPPTKTIVLDDDEI